MVVTMSENSRNAGRDTTKPAELQALAARLRAEADKLPAHLREGALPAAEIVHEHAHAESPDKVTMLSHLRGLSRIAELAPTVNALLEAISGVGL
jgi:hypothetical protein